MPALLEGTSTVVTSVLPTSTGPLARNLLPGSVRQDDHTGLHVAECRRHYCSEDRLESERCAEEEKWCGQAMNVACATWNVPVRMTILRNDTNNADCQAWAPHEPHAKEFACVTRARCGVLSYKDCRPCLQWAWFLLQGGHLLVLLPTCSNCRQWWHERKDSSHQE